MGTRALFKIIDEEGKEICTIYTQFDGYPDGVPLEVVEFIKSKRITNGIPLDAYDEVFNGMDDLAAQVIAFLKLNHSKWLREELAKKKEVKSEIMAGTIYVMPPGTRDVWEEYVYVLKPCGETVQIEAYEVDGEKDKLIFRGKPEEYLKWILLEKV